MLRRLITTLSEGSDFTKRIFLLNNSQKVSPWHDIPLHTSSSHIFQSVIEISNQTTAKFEVSLAEPFNPLKQDTKKNPKTGKIELRHYAMLPIFNYGMLPQTWENPFEQDSKLGLKGDGDPLDILDIGTQPLDCGTLVNVKVLGALCLIDQGELDWKIICVNTEDRLYEKLNGPEDVEKYLPGKIGAIVEWLENIKVFDGKPKNRVEGKVLGPERCLEIIEEGHRSYKRLLNQEFPNAKVWIASKNIKT